MDSITTEEIIVYTLLGGYLLVAFSMAVTVAARAAGNKLAEILRGWRR